MKIPRAFRASLLAFAAVGCFSQASGGQAPYEGLRNKDGLVVVGNDAGLHFTVNVLGKDILKFGGPEEEKLFLSVDRKFLQILASKLESSVIGSPLSSREKLAAHVKWDFEFLQKGLGPATQTTEPFEPTRFVDAIYAVATPKAPGPAKHHLFIYILHNNSVLTIYTIVSDKVPLEVAKKMLFDVALSVQFKEAIIDPQQLAETLNKQNQHPE